ncbi:hypothetical protein F4808DRAFT_84680 [Astrocystis sublimbata]|nr:hypothetical protein F4808DRAFT_84680 [Astrocystis sublimbata]
MGDPKEIARAHWANAQKIRTDILAKLSGPTKERGAVDYTTRFVDAKQIMAEFRLACMNVIFHDFEYAVSKKVENTLWQAHVFINSEYRKALARLNTPNQVVQRRKLDKFYRDFLKISGEFYEVYIQQLHQRFAVPELQQIAREMKPQPTERPANSVEPSAPLAAMVLKSCQMTLVHMGDLARYRCQLSEKFSKPPFDKAADHYGLANSLDPDNGSAHHQLAVLHQIAGQHFDIVYHFHRAIAVANPHELALSNLEREFKKPESASQAKRGPSRDRSQAMITWFVRLHAFFFSGKQFSQHSELEEEVLHHTEVALKREDADDKVLLKMILTNIAAYDISVERVKKQWTTEGSQSSQFLLRFNARMMVVLLRTFLSTLRENTLAIKASDGGESCLSFTPRQLQILPLCRLYFAWVYVTRTDLVQYQRYLEPYVTVLYGLLADILTALTRFVNLTLKTPSSKYLLPEDLEAKGLRPLTDRRLPLFLQVQEQQGTVPVKRVKTWKPHINVFGQEFSRETETVWRIRDIICCGLFLAGSAKFPIVLTTQTEQGRRVETWSFVDDHAAPFLSNEDSLAYLQNKLQFADNKNSQPSIAELSIDESPTISTKGIEHNDVEKSTRGSLERVPNGVPVLNTKTGPVDVTRNGRKSSIVGLGGTIHQSNGKHPNKPPTHYDDSDLLEDDEMVKMVDDLLDDDCPQSGQVHTEPSYGMHSSTANDIFGNFETSPVQPSSRPKAIPGLPWDTAFQSVGHQANSQEYSQASPSGLSIPRSASGQLNGFASSSYLDGLSTSYNQAHPHTLTPRLGTRYTPTSPVPMSSSPSFPRTGYGADSLGDSRSAVLDSLMSSLLAQHGPARNTPSPGVSGMHQGSTTTPTTPAWGQGPSVTENPLTQPVSRLGRSPNDHLYTGTFQPNPLGPPGRERLEYGQVATTAGVNRLATTPNSASHNYVTQDVWGAPQGSSRLRQQYSPRQNEPSTTPSSLAFSRPSSLLTGTPDPVSKVPANTVACNGNYYNATTPFSRLGAGVNNRADPTHFRNQLREAIGTSDLPYDQQIFQAAMMDDNRKPRPK